MTGARIVRDDGAGRAAAVEVLRSGGIVAVPTDTVYGIAAALDVPGGIGRLFAAKRRPPDKAIMLLLADIAQAAEIGRMTAAVAALAAACWPGGLTVVVPQRTDVPLPEELTGGVRTIGLRVPDHPAPRALAAGVGPLPTTSANVSGLPEAHTAQGILDQLGDAVDLVLDGGEARGGPASTVVDCSAGRARILRVGAIPSVQIVAILDAAGLPHAIDAESDRGAGIG
jgi:L-threonylcarbamoyladenylate synthase